MLAKLILLLQILKYQVLTNRDIYAKIFLIILGKIRGKYYGNCSGNWNKFGYGTNYVLEIS